MSIGRIVVLALALSFTGAVSADELITLNGKNVTGSVVAITATDITMKTDAGPTTVPLTHVLALNFRPARGIDPAAKFIDVHLLDETVLHCKSVNFSAKDADLTLLSGVAFKIPLKYIVSLVRDAENQPVTRKFEEYAAQRQKVDRIAILKEGELNILKGSLGDVDEKGQTIRFKSDESDNVLDIPLQKLHGMIFYRPEKIAETPICKVFDVEGNSLAALKLGFEGGNLTVTTTMGAKVVLAQDVVARLDFNNGKLTFLSDLVPAKVVEKSGIGLVNRYRRDLNLDDEPIVLDKQYIKGLSLHAYTELEYNLAGKYKDFKTVLGVDARTGAESQAKVTIYCDGVERWSGVITAKKVEPIAVDVKDVTTLRIVVQSRNIFDLHDHVTLADALVSQ